MDSIGLNIQGWITFIYFIQYSENSMNDLNTNFENEYFYETWNSPFSRDFLVSLYEEETVYSKEVFNYPRIHDYNEFRDFFSSYCNMSI